MFMAVSARPAVKTREEFVKLRIEAKEEVLRMIQGLSFAERVNSFHLYTGSTEPTTESRGPKGGESATRILARKKYAECVTKSGFGQYQRRATARKDLPERTCILSPDFCGETPIAGWA